MKWIFAFRVKFHVSQLFFFFLHIFFLCTKMPKVNSKKNSNETTKKQDEPLKKK